MKLKYIYINENVELCAMLGEPPKNGSELLRAKQSAIVIGNQKRAFQILYQQNPKEVKFGQIIKLQYPAIYSIELNQILN
jgi:hypothetical protein